MQPSLPLKFSSANTTCPVCVTTHRAALKPFGNRSCSMHVLSNAASNWFAPCRLSAEPITWSHLPTLLRLPHSPNILSPHWLTRLCEIGAKLLRLNPPAHRPSTG